MRCPQTKTSATVQSTPPSMRQPAVPDRSVGLLQRAADLSPATGRIAALGVLARGQATRQLKDPRSKNPHNLQTGTTSHHIIPHELLTTIFDKFDKGEKEEIGREFLPDFDNLTMAMFVAQVSVGITYDGVSPNKIANLPEEVAAKPFGELSDDEKGKLVFSVEDAGKIGFDAFRDLYALKVKGTLQEDTSVEGSISGLRDIGDSFFEWQGGNLFYGPDRIEPGEKDGFDYDAALIFGAEFTADLKAIYERLRALEKKNDPASKAAMRQALTELAALTRNNAVPPYDPSIWCPVNSSLKKYLHDQLLPERNKTSKLGASIHRKVLEDVIRRYASNKTLAHQMLLQQRERNAGHVGIFNVSRSNVTFTEDGSVEVPIHNSAKAKLEDMSNAMRDILRTAFGLR